MNDVLRQQPLVPLRIAIARLRKLTGSRAIIVEGMQDRRLRIVIKIPGNDGGYLYIPPVFWNNFKGADFNEENKEKRGLLRGKTLEVRVGALVDLYRLAAEFGRHPLTRTAPPVELWPWFLGLTHRSEQFEATPNLLERSNHLIEGLLTVSELRVPLSVYEPDLVDFQDYIRLNHAKGKVLKPRPVADIFWYKLIEVLSISKIDTGQAAVIETMQRWVVSNYPGAIENRPDCKTIVERIWTENDLAHKVRNRAR